jgi:hypothetical protein
MLGVHPVYWQETIKMFKGWKRLLLFQATLVFAFLLGWCAPDFGFACYERMFGPLTYNEILALRDSNTLLGSFVLFGEMCGRAFWIAFASLLITGVAAIHNHYLK